MGQKSNPIGLRLQINRTWDSRWYAEGRDYAALLAEDIKIRKLVQTKVGNAGIAECQIRRSPKKVTVTLMTSRPGGIKRVRGEGAVSEAIMPLINTAAVIGFGGVVTQTAGFGQFTRLMLESGLPQLWLPAQPVRL